MADFKDTKSTKPHRDFKNVLLFALHVGVLIVSLWVHPIIVNPADKALPYAA